VRRRDFITLLGGTAAGWPVTARAQQQPATLAVGFLADGTPEGFAPRLAAVKRGLYETGFTDGQNVAIEPRWAHRNYELLPSLAGDLVRRKVSVIVTAGSEKVTRVAKDATTTIPIVAIVAGDPVERGLVASINHPGGNLTVVSLFTSSSNVLIAKRVELLHEVAPKVTTIGWLVDTNILDYDDELHELHSAAAAFGLKLAIARVDGHSDLELAVASLVRDGSGTLIESGPIVYENRARVVAAAARATVPMVYEWRTFVDEGGLMSYGSDINSVYRQAGVYAGRVLRGENVGDLPVVQQSKIELIINLKTAKALDLSFPITLLDRADEVIE
jgi:putative tryptophan/tyrosine transport system substrate-binding protein